MRFLFKVLLILIAGTSFSYAQSNLSKAEQEAIDIVKSVIPTYEENIKQKKQEIQKEIDDKKGKGKLTQEKENEKQKLKDTREYNTQMLNLFFAQEVATFFGGSSDLALQKYYATINTKDETIDFGVNFETRESEFDKLNTILTAGFKLKTSDNFGVILKDGDFQNDNVGITFKYVKVNKGVINYASKLNSDGTIKLDRSGITRAYRNEILYPKYEDLIKTYIKELKVEFDRIKSLDELKYREGYSYEANIKNKAKAKKASLYKALVEEEIKYIKSNNLYRYVFNHWWSFDAFIPMGRQSYLISDANSNAVTETKRFWNLEASAGYTLFMKFSNKSTFFVNPRLTFINNNTILSEKLKATTFQTTVMQSETQQAITQSSQVYVLDEFKDFFTPTLSFDGAVFLKQDLVGFSFGADKSFGDYDEFNWRLGIPISLRDKEGKPNINLELQYRDINNTSQIGLSASFIFGKLLN